ncbi:MAG TPA: hypothetical protein VG448_11575 [Solirubrobacterales bacterium]|nr:hypothetical protein [Solirubrobacterales bacterium]
MSKQRAEAYAGKINLGPGDVAEAKVKPPHDEPGFAIVDQGYRKCAGLPQRPGTRWIGSPFLKVRGQHGSFEEFNSTVEVPPEGTVESGPPTKREIACLNKEIKIASEGNYGEAGGVIGAVHVEPFKLPRVHGIYLHGTRYRTSLNTEGVAIPIFIDTVHFAVPAAEVTFEGYGFGVPADYNEDARLIDLLVERAKRAGAP